MFSQQAIILTICNFVIFVAVVLSMFVLKKSTDTEPMTIVPILKNVAALVGFVIVMALQVYSLNCMIYGDCHAWAWVLTAMAVVGTLAYLGIFAYIAMTASKIKSSVKDLVKPLKDEVMGGNEDVAGAATSNTASGGSLQDKK